MKKYTYNETDYFSLSVLKKAIFAAERKVFSTPQNDEQWAALGVTVEDLPDPEEPFSFCKQRKLEALNRAFLAWRETSATLISSLGFRADADERAMIDVSGLVILDAPAVFMDADNVPHELTAQEIKVLQREIIESGNLAYQRKWELRRAISEAEDKEALDAIELVFTPADFSEADE